jgi:hypothetical protein
LFLLCLKSCSVQPSRIFQILEKFIQGYINLVSEAKGQIGNVQLGPQFLYGAVETIWSQFYCWLLQYSVLLQFGLLASSVWILAFIVFWLFDVGTKSSYPV